VDVCKISEQAENLEKPDNKNNHNHNVEDVFDLAIHRDVRIHKPEQDTGDNKYDQNGEEGHNKCFRSESQR
jgi:hypothetical protein